MLRQVLEATASPVRVQLAGFPAADRIYRREQFERLEAIRREDLLGFGDVARREEFVDLIRDTVSWVTSRRGMDSRTRSATLAPRSGSCRASVPDSIRRGTASARKVMMSIGAEVDDLRALRRPTF